MGWRTLGEVRDRSETLGEVREGSGDPWGGPGRVERPSWRSGTGQGSLGEAGTGRGTFGR